MSSSIELKKRNLSIDFVKRTAGLVTGAAGDYISEAMPTTTSTLTEAKATISQVTSAFTTVSQDVLPRIRNIKSQNPIRGIYQWYMDKENEYDDNFSSDTGLEFDTSTDSSEIAEVQIGEAEKNSNKIAKAVVESSRQMVESQIATIANLQTTLDKQTAVISAGFDKTNDTLNKILEVVTKNSSTLIEATVANSKNDPVTNMMKNGRFSANDYKKMLSSNIKNSPEYAMFSMIPMMMNPKNFSPQDMFKVLLDAGLQKSAPNLKKNMKALDDAVNDTIMQSLIRLGNNARNNPYSATGYLGKFFGIDSSRKNQSTERSTLELKSVSFDSITRESITNAIPGYLRKILVAVGGEDVVYDYRSRSFKSRGNVRREFSDNIASRGSIYQASSKVKSAIGTNNASDMFYEMLLTRLGSETDVAKVLESFSNPKTMSKYMNKKVIDGVKFNSAERAALNNFINNFTSLTGNNNGIMDVMMQVSKNNVARNSRASSYISNADAYNVDLSGFDDSVINELNAIAERHGKSIRKGKSSASATPVNPKTMSGVTYTNAALYQIFRRLDEGINVYQVGRGNLQKDPYEKFGNEHLAPPLKYKPRAIKESKRNGPLVTMSNAALSGDDGPNYLQDQLDADGNVEGLTTGQKVGKWAKYRGGNLRRAMFSGSPDQVRAAFGSIISDLSEVAGDQIKKGASRIDSSFGNITGYLKHKMFGTGYSYQVGTDNSGKPIMKKITDNNKGGIFGFITDGFKESLSNGKKYIGNWMNDVKSYFDYGDSSDKDSDGDQITKKRKKFILGSIGAFAGAGILGGPIGMLVGAIGANAISAGGFGKKIKTMLFGDGDRKPGIIKTGIDKIVKPLQFQIGKTVSHISDNLKTNILGPLSDIGFAIKDRMINTIKTPFQKASEFVSDKFKALGEKFQEKFPGITKALDWMSDKIKGGVTNSIMALLRAPLTVPLMLARGASSLITGGTGSMLGGIADKIAKRSGVQHNEYDENGNLIRTLSTRDKIKERSEERKARSRREREYGRYSDYGKWSDDIDERIRSRRNKFSSYVEEATQETAENTAAIAQATSTLTEAVTGEIIPGSSFKTHDQGLHDRIDKLIDVISGKGVSGRSNSGDAEFASSAIGAAASLVTSGDDVSTEEYRLSSSIIDEAAKPNANKSTISQKLRELMGVQKKRSEETGEKKGSILDKLSELIKYLPMIAIAGAGLFGLLKNGGLGDLLTRIGSGLESFAGIFNGSDPTTAGMNAVTSVADVQVSKSWDWSTPLASLFHNETDAAGNKIVNSSATEAKEELLWKQSLRKDLLGGIWNSGTSNRYLNKAIKLEDLSNAQKSRGGFLNNIKSKINKNRSNRALNNAIDYDDAARGPKTSTVKSIGKNVGRIGALGIISKGTGTLAGGIASGLGASDETASTVNRVTTAATSGALTLNMATASIKPGKKAIVDKVVDGITKMLKWFADKAGADKAFKKIGSSKVVSKVTSIIPKITNAIKTKFDDVIIKKVETKLASVGVKNAAAIASGGIAIAAGAIAGLASGFCGTEHLFGVLPGEADAGMTTIASLFGSLFGALEMTPVGWVIVILDIIDAILIAIPGIECGIKQFLARSLYELLGGGDKLAAKQADFNSEKQYYEDKFGVSMNTSTFSDMINNTGFLDRIWSGKAKKGEDGHLQYNADGSIKKSGGIKGGLNAAKDFINGGDKSASLGTTALNALKTINPITGPIATINNAVKAYENSTYELDENGKPILDAEGKKVKRGGLANTVISGIGKVTSIMLNPIEEIAKAAEDWEKNDAPWKKTGSKSNGTAKGWFSNALSKFFGDTVTMSAVGGPAIEEPRTSATSSIATSAESEGGNPLNKAFRITSAYGPRSYPHSGIHKGIDLVPAENTNSPTYVGSRFNGVVTAIKANVPDSDRAVKTANGWEYLGSNSTGNMVTITTDNGLVIKNMHLKANSIPSNIKVGTRVKVGDKIGEMGSTGWSTGDHLHYQIEDGSGNHMDPTSSVANGSTLTNFTSSATSNHMAANSTSSTNGTNISASSSPLMTLINAIMNIGSGFLNAITGGLFGNSSSTSSEYQNSINSSNSVDNSEPISITAANIADNGNGEGIWNYLINQGYTEEGAAGVLGNLYAESGLRPNNLQNSYEKSLGYSDSSYTQAVNDGTYSKDQFVNDSAGYGLAQWTYWSRKKKMYEAAKNSGKSIDDLGFQLPFLLAELTQGGYDPRVKNATSVNEASNVMLMDFERPANAAAKKSQRASYANQFYNTFRSKKGESVITDGNVGGEISNVSNSTYIPKSANILSLNNIGRSSYRVPSYNTMDNINRNPQFNENEVDRTVVKILYEVVSHLKSIANNTGSSSNLLADLNKKDFVDQGLRNTMNALGSSRNKSSAGKAAAASRTNTRTIAAMARP